METIESSVAILDASIILPKKIREIQAIIPHRYPFLLVDRITAHEQGKSVQGYKHVTINEPFFQGHFPGDPIMPGVLQIEALAQLGTFLVKNMPQGKDKLGMLIGIDNTRFRKMVTPGDSLEMRVELLKLKGPIGKLKGEATVNGEIAVETEILFAMQEPQN